MFRKAPKLISCLAFSKPKPETEMVSPQSPGPRDRKQNRWLFSTLFSGEQLILSGHHQMARYWFDLSYCKIGINVSCLSTFKLSADYLSRGPVGICWPIPKNSTVTDTPTTELSTIASGSHSVCWLCFASVPTTPLLLLAYFVKLLLYIEYSKLNASSKYFWILNLLTGLLNYPNCVCSFYIN